MADQIWPLGHSLATHALDHIINLFVCKVPQTLCYSGLVLLCIDPTFPSSHSENTLSSK